MFATSVILKCPKCDYVIDDAEPAAGERGGPILFGVAGTDITGCPRCFVQALAQVVGSAVPKMTVTSHCVRWRNRTIPGPVTGDQ